MSLSPPAVLLACAHVILSRGNWCQGSRAQDEAGVQCSPLSPRAVAWDLEGALLRAAYFVLALPTSGSVHADPVYREARVLLIGTCPGAPSRRHRRWRAESVLADYNDAPERTKAEVLALIEAVLSEKEGGTPPPSPEVAGKALSTQEL